MNPPDWKTENLPLLVGTTALFVVCVGLSAGIWWWRSRSAQLNPGNAPRVGYLQTDGSARRRHASTIRWDDISDRATLFLRDLLYTPPETVAYLILDNQKRLLLPPGSMVELDQQTVDSREIQLVEPEKLMLAAVPNQGSLFWFPDPKVWEWRQSEVDDRKSKFVAAELTFQPLLTLGRMARGPLEAILTDFEIRLGSPKMEKKTDSVRLRWSPVLVKDVRYEAQVSTEPSFARYTSHLSTTSSVEIPVAQSGTYYWRVLAIAGGEALPSEHMSFTFSSSGKRIVEFRPETAPVALTGAARASPPEASLKGQGRELSAVRSSSGGPTTPGLTKPEIDAVVQPKLRELRRCVENSAKGGKGYEGRLVLSFRIEGTGRTYAISFKSSKDLGSPLEACLFDKIAGWRFPPPRAGQEVAADYPLVFATIRD